MVGICFYSIAKGQVDHLEVRQTTNEGKLQGSVATNSESNAFTKYHLSLQAAKSVLRRKRGIRQENNREEREKKDE